VTVRPRRGEQPHRSPAAATAARRTEYPPPVRPTRPLLHLAEEQQPARPVAARRGGRSVRSSPTAVRRAWLVRSRHLLRETSFGMRVTGRRGTTPAGAGGPASC
jgi:hypothetical protein